MTQNVEREQVRVSLQTGVKVQDGGQTFIGSSRDISLAGMYILALEAPRMNSEVRVQILHQDKWIQVDALVVRHGAEREPAGFAVRFAGDLEGVEHIIAHVIADILRQIRTG